MLPRKRAITGPCWTPDKEQAAMTRVATFLSYLREFHGVEAADYDALWNWSIERPELFWKAVWGFTGVTGKQGELVLIRKHCQDMLGADWFPNASLNFAENLLRPSVNPDALVFWGENKVKRTLSRQELHNEVAQLAAAMRNLGVVEGDRVAAWLPNMPEAIVAMLAASSIGAIFTSASPDFGVQGALDRFGQVAPTFNHPLYILYSSGTTGMPKCIVHGAGGTLLQHLKEHQLHGDVREGDRLFYFSTCGWMMWNWLATGLASGATLLLYDGSAFAVDGRVLFDYAQAERMTHFGTSAKYIDALAKTGLVPNEQFELTSLRSIFSTGSPLSAEGFDFVYHSIKSEVQLSSISGGTDIVSCFVLGSPMLPVWRGEIQCRGLGMAVDVFDDNGKPVRGEKGELVCTQPFPSMPLGFWNDEDGARYRAAYFERFPGIWCHGDFCEITEHGGLIIHGRSDTTLNPGGVRIGTAEIYRQVERLPEVLESLVIAQTWPPGSLGDVRIVLFVKLRDGVELTEDMVKRINSTIRVNTTPRHVPDKVLAVSDMPRTKSGKLVELAVRNVVHGEPVKNMEALLNPEALEYFRERPELTTG